MSLDRIFRRLAPTLKAQPRHECRARFLVEPASRLCCQILMSPGRSGLRVGAGSELE
jgi:hypothetical protein